MTELIADNLRGLKIAPIRFHLRTTTAFQLPQYKGAIFRGGFGQFFRDLVCVTRAPVCAGCTHLSSCAYSIVFETPVIPENFSVLRKYPNAPHPFVLGPPLDARETLPAGVELCLDFTLVGRGLDYFPHFIRVVDAMGHAGRYGGAFRIERITSACQRDSPANGHAVLFDGRLRKITADPPLWNCAAEPSPVKSLRLEFVTPLRMRTEGRYNPSPDFVAVTHALLGRLHLLTAIYGGGTADRAWLRPLMAQADTVRTERAEFEMFRWDRMSGRQQRRVAMDGVVGSLTASGDLTALAPAYRAGELLNIGSGTSMGLGKYRAVYGN